MKKRILSLLLSLALAMNFVPSAFAAKSEPIRIAVIDTGISTAVISADNLAPGKNYILPDESTEDKHGHGTAVVSLIVGSKESAVQGMCPEAVIVPLVWASRDEDGNLVQGKAEMAAQAIRDAIDVYGCRIINLSAGTANNHPDLWEVVDYAEEKGVLIVSSAGNDGTDKVYYPGADRTVVCVGSCNAEGTQRSWFSNTHDRVDLLAPGENLRVAGRKSGSTLVSGTSFSTAVVTGAAAQIWTNHPELTADQVREAILSSTRTVDGWPVLDLDAALAWGGSEPAIVFSDVAEGAYYYDAVHWAVENGVTNGVSATEFAPNTDCTQAHILTFLWRAAGSPVLSADNRYTNDAVTQGAYFYEAFLWAWEKGLISDGTPDPKAACSRSDVVTYLWKLAGSPAADSAAFDDVAADTPYSAAVAWAVEQKVTNGGSTTRFGPDEICTRAQIVTFLHRYFVE